MKNNTIIHAILYGLLTNIIPTIATESPRSSGHNSALTSPQLSPRNNSTHTSPQCSPRNNNRPLTRSSSDPITIPTTTTARSLSSSPTPQPNDDLIKRRSREALQILMNDSDSKEKDSLSSSLEQVIPIKNFFKSFNSKYYKLNSDGTLDEGNILIRDGEQKRNSYYKAKLIITENETFIHATHLLNGDNGAVPLNKEDKFSILTSLTTEQIEAIAQESLPHDNKEVIFAIDNYNNSYYISDFTRVESKNISSLQSDSTSEQGTFAIITDNDGSTYECYICSTHDKCWIEIDKKNEFGNVVETIKKNIPTENKSYEALISINKNQCVVIDNDHNLYIASKLNNEIIYILQSNVDENGTMLIIPFEEKNVSHVEETFITLPNDHKASTQQTTPSREQNKESTNVTKSTSHSTVPKIILPNNKNNHRTYRAVGTLTVVAIILGIMYKYDKFLSLTELLTSIQHRIKNFNFGR